MALSAMFVVCKLDDHKVSSTHPPKCPSDSTILYIGTAATVPHVTARNIKGETTMYDAQITHTWNIIMCTATATDRRNLFKILTCLLLH